MRRARDLARMITRLRAEQPEVATKKEEEEEDDDKEEAVAWGGLLRGQPGRDLPAQRQSGSEGEDWAMCDV